MEEGIQIARNSPLGAFIRRATVEYQRLRFHDCTELWKDFVRYRQPTMHQQKRKNSNIGKPTFDNVLLTGAADEGWSVESVSALASVTYDDMLSGDHVGRVAVSTDDIELLLDFQIEQMQSRLLMACSVCNANGTQSMATECRWRRLIISMICFKPASFFQLL